MIPDTANRLQPLPRHVAIIMDGNGRWAQSQGRARHAGHRAGVRTARAVVEAAVEQNIQVLTLFAFSSENWKRPATEVDGLMRLFVEVLQREVDALHNNGIQLRFIGARETLPTILRKRMADAEAKTAGNSRMTLVLAVAYGGHWDIVQAARRVAAKVKSGDLDPLDIDEGVLQRHTSLAGLPQPDLLVRTGGEQRISNFLLWDLAYTELLFTDTLWPDFDALAFRTSIEHYRSRQRRFGKVVDQREAMGGE